MLNKFIFGLLMVLMLLSCTSEARRLKNKYQNSGQGTLSGYEGSSLLEKESSEIPKIQSQQIRSVAADEDDVRDPEPLRTSTIPGRPPGSSFLEKDSSEIPKPGSKQVQAPRSEDPDLMIPNFPNRGWAPPPSLLGKSNMEDEMAKWDVSGTQGLGDSCSFWSAKWCQVGLRCSSGTCVQD